MPTVFSFTRSITYLLIALSFAIFVARPMVVAIVPDLDDTNRAVIAHDPFSRLSTH